MPDLVIRDARMVLPEGIVRGEVSVVEGRIHEVALTGIPRGEVEIRANGKLVIPGVVDGHTHFYNRKYVYRENFRSGSIAAVAGGVTTVAVSLLDDPINTVTAAKKIILTGENNSVIDFMLHAGGLTPSSIKNVVKLVSLGITSLKVSNCRPYPSTYDGIERLMSLAEKLNSLVVAYPEDAETLSELRKKLIEEHKTDLLSYVQGHPPEAEERGLSKIAEIAHRTGCRVHIAPVTTEIGCEKVSKLKSKKYPLTAETCPHYLIFTVDDLKKLGAELKVTPPIRTHKDLSSLWEAINSGLVDIVTSGHAPTTKGEKDSGKVYAWGSPSGIPSLETLLPVMLSEGAVKGRISLEKLVTLLCSKPAQIFGLYPMKGVIRSGSDADIVIVDTAAEIKVRAEDMHYAVNWTPYEGMKLRGKPVTTISRGEVLMEDGVLDCKRAKGRFLGKKSSEPEA
ncbi:MAG: amidohydrolase family protein [Candidatus Hadarchaeales archaeon]